MDEVEVLRDADCFQHVIERSRAESRRGTRSQSAPGEGRAEVRRRAAYLRSRTSAALLWAAAVPMGKFAITDKVSMFLLLASLAVLTTRKVESVWVILGAALVQLAALGL